jgi:L-2,4-diaminobutyrate decarboxylase
VDEFREVGQPVLAQLAGYLEASQRGQVPAVGCADGTQVAERLELDRWLSGDRMRMPDLLAFVANYCALSASHLHPGYFAHQIAPPDVPGIVADLIQAVTNNISLIHELAPAGTTVDHAMYRWMTAKAGWAATGTGTLTQGGSLGNLIALLAARTHAYPGSWRSGNPGGLVLLAPQTSHYSLAKAAAVLGIGLDNLLPVAVDTVGRIDPAKLPDAISAARRRGATPFALIANACATATGLYDPIGDIGEVCAAENIWLHVDGAHGASALLSPWLRDRLDGLPLARSLVWDAHKMLRASALCTGVIFREAADFDLMFRQDASYLFREEAAELDMGQRTFETSKPPLGLKLLLTLAVRGESALREYIEAQYKMAVTLWQMIQERDDFSCPYQPESNILCFRYDGQPDRQLYIRDRLRESGRFYLSFAKINDTGYLRAAIMSPNTTEETLAELLDAIAKVAAEE